MKTDAIDRDRIVELDRRHVWHPYTQMLDYGRRDPVVVERGEGVRLVDMDGRAYWDGVSSIWLNVHGHKADRIDAAIKAQLDRIAHSTLLGQANVPSVLLAEQLVRVAPRGLTRVFYSDNGSGAVESALKIAVQYWHHKGQPEKRKVLSFGGGYHGDTLGAVGVAPVEVFHAPFLPLLPRNLQVGYPYCYRCPWGKKRTSCAMECVDELEAIIRANAHELAAVFVEPMVQGVGGIVVMPDGYLSRLRELCTRYDVLLVADEVATGFGRTGRLWACDHEGVSPDIMATGKGITGGYLPLAATLVREEIYEAFLGEYCEMKAFFHGHSYTGNQLACAAALASLEMLEEMLPSIPRKAAVAARELERFRGLRFVGDVRQKGLMMGLELVADKATKRPFPFEERVGFRVALRARERGLLVRPYASISILMPPLASTEEELKAMLDAFYGAHADAEEELAGIAGAPP